MAIHCGPDMSEEKQYLVLLTRSQIEAIGWVLPELPWKIADPVIQTLREQVQRIDEEENGN